MNVVTARLVFLAFFGLNGTIIYNALYLQDPHGSAAMSTPPSNEAGAASRATSVGITNIPSVSTDLPPLDDLKGESQLLVRAVQRELAARDYDVGDVDGKLSDKTKAAISSYERHEGLPVTGIATDDLLHHILLGANAKAVATGSVARNGKGEGKTDVAATVKALQQSLADLGYSPGPIDGTLGSATASAISAFQRDRKIPDTGRITPELLLELKQVTGQDLTKTAAKP
jgi:peptidoglycan hydrolase-like protein with peptidoglycan-binding domain